MGGGCSRNPAGSAGLEGEQWEGTPAWDCHAGISLSHVIFMSLPFHMVPVCLTANSWLIGPIRLQADAGTPVAQEPRCSQT